MRAPLIFLVLVYLSYAEDTTGWESIKLNPFSMDSGVINTSEAPLTCFTLEGTNDLFHKISLMKLDLSYLRSKMTIAEAQIVEQVFYHKKILELKEQQEKVLRDIIDIQSKEIYLLEKELKKIGKPVKGLKKVLNQVGNAVSTYGFYKIIDQSTD